ncbi:hypothetical protein BKA65DRAFT_599131 [Rhexocercosporidium sp. MPI-PUGE-AT-0058]|nr:hypothetical protein BKA65DRAFT_599131 [Rhexocercosporidium sp. MPI-PUGE-AT-0058]
MVDKKKPRRGRSGTRSDPLAPEASVPQVVIPSLSNTTSSSSRARTSARAKTKAVEAEREAQTINPLHAEPKNKPTSFKSGSAPLITEDSSSSTIPNTRKPSAARTPLPSSPMKRKGGPMVESQAASSSSSGVPNRGPSTRKAVARVHTGPNLGRARVQTMVPAPSNLSFQFGVSDQASAGGENTQFSTEALPDYSNINFASLAEKVMTNKVPLNELSLLAPSLFAGEKGTGIKRSIEQYRSKQQPFGETNPGFQAFSQSLQPQSSLNANSAQIPSSNQRTQPQLVAPRIPEHFNNPKLAPTPTHTVVQGVRNTPPYQRASIPQLQVPNLTQKLQPTEDLQPFQSSAPYVSLYSTKHSFSFPQTYLDADPSTRRRLSPPQGSSRLADNNPPPHAVQPSTQQLRNHPDLPFPSTTQLNSYQPATSRATGNSTASALPQQFAQQQKAASGTPSTPLPQSTRTSKLPGLADTSAAARLPQEIAQQPPIRFVPRIAIPKAYPSPQASEVGNRPPAIDRVSSLPGSSASGSIQVDSDSDADYPPIRTVKHQISGSRTAGPQVMLDMGGNTPVASRPEALTAGNLGLSGLNTESSSSQPHPSSLIDGGSGSLPPSSQSTEPAQPEGSAFAASAITHDPTQNLESAAEARPIATAEQVMASELSEQEKEVRRQNLKAPRRRSNRLVSRNHAELDPPQVKISRDDVDRVLYGVAREILGMLQGQVRKRNLDEYTLIVNNWQDRTDYVNIFHLPVSHAAQNGLDIGHILVERAFQTDQFWVLPALARMMANLEEGADGFLQKMTAADHAELQEWGIASWTYTQQATKAFSERAKEVIVAAACVGQAAYAAERRPENPPAREIIYEGRVDGDDLDPFLAAARAGAGFEEIAPGAPIPEQYMAGGTGADNIDLTQADYAANNAMWAAGGFGPFAPGEMGGPECGFGLDPTPFRRL